MASRAGLNCIVLTMPEVSPAFRDMILGYGAFPVFLPAEDRWPALRALQELPGTYPVSNLTSVHTGHPWGPEGYKTIAYEILADLDGQVPSAVVVPTGYGEMLYGIYKGFNEARLLGHTDRIPQLVSVEPAARGPLPCNRGRGSGDYGRGEAHFPVRHGHDHQWLSLSCRHTGKQWPADAGG